MHHEALLGFGQKLIARTRVLAAKLGVELAAEQPRHHRRVLHEVDLEAVEVGQALAEVAVEPLAHPMRAAHVLDELEGARAHDLGFRVFRVLLELGGAVDAVEGRSQQRQEGGVDRLELEDDGGRIRRLDGGDVGEALLAHRDHALGWVGDALEGRLDVGRGQRRAVVELDAVVQRESVGEAVRGDRPALGQIADDLRVLGAVPPDQQRILRGHRMQQREGLGGVAVVRGGLGDGGETERTSTFGRFRQPRGRGQDHSGNSRKKQRWYAQHNSLPWDIFLGLSMRHFLRGFQTTAASGGSPYCGKSHVDRAAKPFCGLTAHVARGQPRTGSGAEPQDFDQAKTC